MAHKKTLPKKLGSVKIPKSLRKIGNKALANPEVAGIVSGALASVAALVAARGVAKSVSGEEAALASGGIGIAPAVRGVVKQAFSDILVARSSARAKASGADKSKSAKGARPTFAEGTSKGQNAGKDRRH
jgi:uncharacterized transporter YbjL